MVSFSDVLPRGKGAIPGTLGRSIPGSAKLPGFSALGSGFKTQIVSDKSISSSQFRDFHFRQVRDVKGRFAGGWGFAWQGLAAMNDNLIAFNDEVHSSLRARAEELKDAMVEYAKKNYPWTPREDGKRGVDEGKPHAHEALQGAVVWNDPEHCQIFIGHGPTVYYGIWLEVRWGGRYAIIVPTIEYFGSRIGGFLTGGPK